MFQEEDDVEELNVDEQDINDESADREEL